MMRKGTFWLLAIVIIITLLAVFAWPYLRIGFINYAEYRETDRVEYNYYTPELLKTMPRLTNDYKFSYSNISGPQAYVYELLFKGISDPSKIREHLHSRGYLKQEYCSTTAECWRLPHSTDIVSFYASEKLNQVAIEIYRSSYAE